jgi:hypothetical protein
MCSYRLPLHLRHKSGLDTAALVHLHALIFSFCISHFLYYNTNFYVQFNDKSLPIAGDRYNSDMHCTVCGNSANLTRTCHASFYFSLYFYTKLKPKFSPCRLLSHFKQRSCDLNKVFQNTLDATITVQKRIKKYPTFPRNMSPPSKNKPCKKKKNSRDLLLGLFFESEDGGDIFFRNVG